MMTLDRLLHDGVLRESAASRWSPNRPIGFSHPILFDYAASILALGEVDVADSLADALDADPDLVMLLRPSLDYRIAIAWHNEPTREGFWRLALRLASEQSGHVLAAAAAAAVAARELGSIEDLPPLETACTTAAVGAGWTTNDARMLAFHLAAGISDAGASVSPAMDAFGQLTARVADHAARADDFDLASLAAQLIRRAQGDHPPVRGSAVAEYWVRTAVASMAVALVDPTDSRRAQLVEVACSVLATAVVLDATALSQTVRETIAVPTLRAWGANSIRHLIDVLAEIASEDSDLAVEVGTSVWLFDDDRSQVTSLSGSRILPLTSNRQQDLEGARYQVGTNFPALTSVDPVAAARLLIAVLDSRPSPAAYHNDDSDTEQRPRVRHGESLRYLGGHDVVSKMVDAFVQHLDVLAQNGSPVVDPIVTLLIDQASHAQFWNRLLHRAATVDSPALATALVPALITPPLFTHGETWHVAGHVAARLSRMLPVSDHYAIEEAIVLATDPTDDDVSRRDRLQQRRDRLLGSLDADRISHPVARRQVDTFTSSGQPVPPLPPSRQDDDDLFVRMPPEPEAVDESPHAQVMRDVADAVEQASRSADGASVRQRLLAAWPALMAIPVDDPAAERARYLQVRAADRLAHLPEAGPGSTIGAEILTVVRAALPAPGDAGNPLRKSSSRHASWGVTPATDALTIARTLISRGDWRASHGQELTGLLAPYLDSPSWAYRYLSTGAIGLLFPKPGDLLAEAERRLAIEPDTHVAGVLVDAVARHALSRPFDVDKIFSRLAPLRGSALALDAGNDDFDNDHPVALVVQALTLLAVRYVTPYADATIRSWLSKPIEHVQIVATVGQCLRDLLNPPEPALRDSQQRAFDLLTLTTEPLRESWRHLARSTDHDDVTKERAKGTVAVADGLAQQVYFASGAFDTKRGKTKRRGDPVIFADFAIPLLEGLAQVHYPIVTHHIVETATHLSDSRPERALLLATKAVTADGAFASESLGLDATLTLVNRYVADHRNTVLGTLTCTTAVRSVLEPFVRAGWPRAIRLAERMDELFR